MRLLPKSIHRCHRYPTKFNSGRDIPAQRVSSLHLSKGRLPPLARSQTQTLSC